MRRAKMTKEELYALIGKEVKLSRKGRVGRDPLYTIGTVTDFTVEYYLGANGEIVREIVILYFDEAPVSLEGWEIVDPVVGSNGADSESNA